MFTQYRWEQLQLSNQSVRKRWCAFLQKMGLREDPFISYCVGVYDGSQLIATGSYYDNVIKCIAIDTEYSAEGNLFHSLLSHLLNKLAYSGQKHIFVYTSPATKYAFVALGFTEIACTNTVCVLEWGMPSLETFRKTIPTASHQNVGAIVVNANPFTFGHRALVQYARQHVDFLYIFVLASEKSLFSFLERKALVEAGVADIDAVAVCSGGPYMIGSATFPSYFLKKTSDLLDVQTELDATVFKRCFAQPLHITARFVGTEEDDAVTNAYNQALQRVLPPEVSVYVLPRICTAEHKRIRASNVRQAIVESDWKTIMTLVPQTTYDFIQKHADRLRATLNKKELKINEDNTDGYCRNDGIE